jgi:hypothetical protein
MAFLSAKFTTGDGMAMSIRIRTIAAIVALFSPLTTAPIVAQHVPQANGDTRQVVALTPSEAEIMLTGMRTYLETIQGIVAALADNDTMHSSDIAAKSGARMLDSVAPTTGLKVPLDFTMISLDTHDKFDKLADKMRRGTSRTEVLSDMRNIMSNCISCHASYRLAP